MAITYYDPTDHHPVPAPQRPLYATGAELLQARIARGICSDADCGLPIDGWCVTCRAKLCERHLHDHHNQHTREYLHAQAAQMADDPDELAARRRAAGAVAAEVCGVDDLRSELPGDNGGCHEPAVDTCDACGLPICPRHSWWVENETVCSVCYGVYGVERRERSGGDGQQR